jgi:ribosomal protein S18 acetylase RimI-like enzyme
MRVTSLGFLTDVALRVLEGAETTDRGDYLVVRTPDNPDFYWGNFLLLGAWPGPGTGDGWLARFAAEFPQARHVALGVDAADGPAAAPAEFLAAGLEPERVTVLTSAGIQPPPNRNTEAEIRPLESDDDWRQSFDLGVRCYGERGPYLERRASARRRLTEARRAAWFGAFTGGRLLAQLGVCDAGGGLARYQDVETDPAARRRGLAGTLVWRAGRYAAEVLGAGTLVIVADPAEAAIRLYRACGFADAQGQFSFQRAPES